MKGRTSGRKRNCVVVQFPGRNKFKKMITLALTQPQKDTFQLLGLRSNSASVAVLGLAVGSPCDRIRLAALQTLVARGGSAEMAMIVEKIDYCSDQEVPLLKNHVPLLIAPIEACLADKDPIQVQRAIVAIAKLKISSQFHHIVRIASSPEDLQQMVAIELLLELACFFGTHSRLQRIGSMEESRETLLTDVWNSMEQFHEHRVTQIVDAWLCLTHWEDVTFKELFRPDRRDSLSKAALRQLRHTHRPEVLELTAGILWSKGPSIEALQVVGERKEEDFPSYLSRLMDRFGVTPLLQQNLRQNIPMRFLEGYDMLSDVHSIEHRCAMLKIFAVANLTPDRMLASILDLLQTGDKKTEPECAAAMRSLRSLKPELVVMVLSDHFNVPDIEDYVPPPWKADLRAQLDRLLTAYETQSQSMRSAIEYAFSDFTCEEMLNHFDDWPDSHLHAYGRMVRIADRSHVAYIEQESKSQSQVKRSRSIKAIRFMGADGRLGEIAMEALQDKCDSVRIEAIYTIAPGLSRGDANEFLNPLLQDQDANVRVAAGFAISQIKDVP